MKLTYEQNPASVWAMLSLEQRRDVDVHERYRLMREDSYPVALPSGPKLVVHLMPDVAAADTKSRRPVKDLPANNMVPFLEDSSGGGSRLVFDGRLFYQAAKAYASSATLVFHSGIVEATTELVHQSAPPENRGMSLPYMDSTVRRFVSDFVNNGLAERTTGFPLRIRVAVLDATTVAANPQGTTETHTGHGLAIRQRSPALVLPDVVLKDDSQDIDVALGVALERMWHAWGFPRQAN